MYALRLMQPLKITDVTGCPCSSTPTCQTLHGTVNRLNDIIISYVLCDRMLMTFRGCRSELCPIYGPGLRNLRHAKRLSQNFHFNGNKTPSRLI